MFKTLRDPHSSKFRLTLNTENQNVSWIVCGITHSGERWTTKARDEKEKKNVQRKYIRSVSAHLYLFVFVYACMHGTKHTVMPMYNAFWYGVCTKMCTRIAMRLSVSTTYQYTRRESTHQTQRKHTYTATSVEFWVYTNAHLALLTLSTLMKVACRSLSLRIWACVCMKCAFMYESHSRERDKRGKKTTKRFLFIRCRQTHTAEWRRTSVCMFRAHSASVSTVYSYI